MFVQCEKCRGTFQAREAPCPDGIEGCLVAHYDEQSWICPECGHNNISLVSLDHIRIYEKPGFGIANLRGIKKLHL